jgi:hypothetical protein
MYKWACLDVGFFSLFKHFAGFFPRGHMRKCEDNPLCLFSQKVLLLKGFRVVKCFYNYFINSQ